MGWILGAYADFPTLAREAAFLYDANFGLHDIAYDDQTGVFRLRLEAPWLADLPELRACASAVPERGRSQETATDRFELVLTDVEDCKIICDDPFLEQYPSFEFSRVEQGAPGVLWLLTHYVVSIRLRVRSIRAKLVACRPVDVFPRAPASQ